MPGLADRLNKLRTKATPKETAKPNKKVRPVIEIDKSSKEIFLKLAKMKEVLDLAKSQHDTLNDLLKSKLFDKFISMMKRENMQPENPALKVTDSNTVLAEGIFQVKEKIKVKTPDIRAELLRQGFSEELVNKILEENVEEVDEINLTPLHELACGKVTKNERIEPTPVQAKLADKLVSFIEKLTQEEHDALVSLDKTIVIRSGILDRLPGYCKDVEELKKLLAIFTPELATSGVKFAKDNPSRATLLVDAVKEMVGLSD